MAEQNSLRIDGNSLSYIEAIYADYAAGAVNVPPEWARFFQSLDNGSGGNGRREPFTTMPFPPRSVFNPAVAGAPPIHAGPIHPGLDIAGLQERLDQLIRNYRVRGHILAKLDPLGTENSPPVELDPAFYGFSEDDFDRELSTSWVGGPETRTLRGIINWLKQTYCRSIGAQFMHIDSLSVRQWLQERMERTGNRIRLSRDEQLRILKRLADAIVFEEFLARKFVGAKSFSLEGGETLIPLLDLAIEKAGRQGIEEIVIGMAHRGRLNVLANIMGKSPREIFREFDDADPHLHVGRGDVKYHLGYSSDWRTSQGHRVHLSLCFNPSHLEFVNPVAMGRVRAKQDRFGDFSRDRGAVILIHGDAAFAGEGVVQETLNMSQLDGYHIGGTVHIIVNNQLGFTTPPNEGRSTTYCTDVAKMLQIPIFHVNGEDPEAVAQVVNMALDFRERYQRDVVIDMYCYRRRGHNEGDEPEFTQPAMYRVIKKRKSVYEGYLDYLLNLGGVTREEADGMIADCRQVLERELDEARRDDYIACIDHLGGIWSGYRGGSAAEADQVHTGVDRDTCAGCLEQLVTLPDDFKPHPKVKRLLKVRDEMARGDRPLDWGAAEALAFGTILADGHPLRMTGQDVGRGTFSQRHAVLYDYESGAPYVPLTRIEPRHGRVEIFNSPLSEAGVLGFEYGYSLDCPEGLVIWEAQFGDFVNAAQVIIDQFIASAEDKWDRLSGLVMLLPHGFEGQGPEHSSARLERFLMLAAEDNIQIAQPSTPAQYFHMLRRQTIRRWKKPLIVMTPKSLLRHPLCVSPLDELEQGRFEPVLDEIEIDDRQQVRRILACSGKVYFDLLEQRRSLGRQDVAIIRLEELYPLSLDALKSVLDRYNPGTPFVWVQEEPENMGAWRYLWARFGDTVLDSFPLSVISRPESASPATGSAGSHRQEQQAILDAAFDLDS
ncbi:MAG: 2-oxoglutarate dehydrogenase E1 component [Maioricimonas sp. JB045]|uniref:2-oxoglutarate dehydrogenase E1 component n=1 Tax=Maioricimonas sp. JC845 TaxID=3232138 RepID=UPI00345819DB